MEFGRGDGAEAAGAPQFPDFLTIRRNRLRLREDERRPIVARVTLQHQKWERAVGEDPEQRGPPRRGQGNSLVPRSRCYAENSWRSLVC